MNSTVRTYKGHTIRVNEAYGPRGTWLLEVIHDASKSVVLTARKVSLSHADAVTHCEKWIDSL